MKRGILIQVEGTDKAGKQTQTEWLAKMLAIDGYTVSLIPFPQYDTPAGKLIYDFLHGYLPFSPADQPHLTQAIYTINRYECQQRIERALTEGKIVICDRYIGSSIAYGMGDGLPLDWILQISHSLVQPDITVILEISDEEYARRCNNYSVLDHYESKLEYIRKARVLYHKVAEVFGGRVIPAEGKPEVVAQEVYRFVKEKMSRV
jgi:dTMP kinase